MPGDLRPDAAADKARLAASAVAKATAALAAIASVHAVDAHIKGIGEAPDLLPQPTPTVGATRPAQSLPQAEILIVETPATVAQTPTHTDEFEFPKK